MQQVKMREEIKELSNRLNAEIPEVYDTERKLRNKIHGDLDKIIHY